MADIAALGLRVDGTQNIDKATASLNDFSKAGSSAEKSTSGVANSSKKAQQGVRDLAKSTEQAAGSMRDMAAIGARVGGILGAAFSVNAIKNYADQWSDLQSRVGAATKNMDGAAKQMSRLVDIANASYSSLEQTVSAYAGNVGALQDLGKSAADAADYTESLNHMLVLTATRGERAASVQNALSKAMAVGKLQAEGLETVLANGGEVAAALAKELGTTVSGLRALASDGKITGAVIADAIIKPLEDVRARAAEMPATIGDAFTRIQTNTTELVGVFDKLTGASEAVASGIISAADSMRNLSKNTEVLENIAKAGEVLAVVIGSRLVASTVASAAAFTAKAVQAGVATVALKAYEGQSLKTAAANTALAASARAASGAMALLGGPAGVVVTALGLAALAWSSYGDSARDNADEGVLGLVDTKKGITDLINEFEKLNKIQQQQTIDIKTQDMAEAAKDASRAFFDLGNAFSPAMDQGTRAAAQFRADFNADIKDVADNTDLSADQMANALVRVIDEYINSGRATEASRKKMLEYAQALATAKGEVNGLRGELAALSNVQGVYTEGMGNSSVVQKQNEALERTVQAAINATKSFRSTAERVNEVRESSNQAAEALKALEASGKGASEEANILRGRIQAANAEIEKLQKGSSGAASSKVKLKNASKELETQIRREQAAYAQLVEMQQEAADYYVQLSKNQEALGQALDKTTREIQEQSELLDLEERMIGKSNEERQLAIELLQIERDLRKEIDEIDRMDLPGGEASREEARVRARENAAKKIANAERKVYIDTWKNINQYIEDGLYDAIVTGGASAKDALMRMFENMVLRPVVQAAVGSLFGGSSGSAASGAGGVLSGAQNLSSLYNSFSGGLVSTVGGAIGKLGATFGSSALTSFAAGMKGSTLAAGLAGPTTAGASGFMGAGAMAGAALPWVAGGLAIASLLGGLDFGSRGANHVGGAYSSSGLTDKQITQALGLGSGNRAGDFIKRSNDALDQSVAGLASGLLGAYNTLTGVIGGSALSANAAFAVNPKHKDENSYGYFQLLSDATGEIVAAYSNRKLSKDHDEAWQQYSSEMASAFVEQLRSADIAGWADDILTSLGDTVTVEGFAAAAQQIAAVDAAFKGWAKTLTGFSGVSAEVQTALIRVSGGFDALNNNLNSFYANFYSDQERYQASLKQMRDVLADLNLSIDPAAGERAKQEFRKTAEDALKAGNAELYAQMLSIGQAFDQVATYAAKSAQAAADAARDAANAVLDRAQSQADAAMRQLEASVNREKTYWSKIVDASQQAISSLSTTLRLLEDNAARLYGSVQSASQMQAAQGAAYIEQALNAVKRGASISSFAKLGDAISAATGGLGNKDYASRFEQERDALILANQLSELGDYTESQLSVEERSLKAAQYQIEQLDQTLQYWQQALEMDQFQIDATMSVGAAISGLSASISALASAQAAARAAETASWSSSIVAATPGSVGGKVDLYQQMYSSGMSDNDIRNAVYEATGNWQTQSDWDLLKSLAGVPSYDVGTPFVPQDQLALIHKGEAVIPAEYNPFNGAAKGSNTDALIAQLISDNRTQAGEIIRLNARVARLLERWDGDGMPETREVALA